jgi:hypothetical protein
VKKMGCTLLVLSMSMLNGDAGRENLGADLLALNRDIALLQAVLLKNNERSVGPSCAKGSVDQRLATKCEHEVDAIFNYGASLLR